MIPDFDDDIPQEGIIKYSADRSSLTDSQIKGNWLVLDKGYIVSPLDDLPLVDKSFKSTQ